MRFDLVERLYMQYAMLRSALNGKYLLLRQSGTQITPHALNTLRAECMTLNRTFLDSAVTEINTYLDSLNVAGNDTLRQGFALRLHELTVRLSTVLIDNLLAVVKMARTGGRGVSAMVDAHGGMGALIQKLASSEIEFKAVDSSGRRWDAAKLFHTLVRDFAYQCWIDRQAAVAYEGGEDLMQTQNGTIFSLRGHERYPSFESVRDALFHINSNQTMVPYVPA